MENSPRWFRESVEEFGETFAETFGESAEHLPGKVVQKGGKIWGKAWKQLSGETPRGIFPGRVLGNEVGG